MNSPSTTQAALLSALEAIVNEVMDYSPVPRHDLDSYLPKHLIEAAQRAIAQAKKQKGNAR